MKYSLDLELNWGKQKQKSKNLFPNYNQRRIKTIKMQKSIYSFAITAFSAMTILIGCEPSAEKVDSEKAKLEAAEIDLIKVKENYFIEYNKLKYKSEKQFSDNATRIRELRKQN